MCSNAFRKPKEQPSEEDIETALSQMKAIPAEIIQKDAKLQDMLAGKLQRPPCCGCGEIKQSEMR